MIPRKPKLMLKYFFKITSTSDWKNGSEMFSTYTGVLMHNAHAIEERFIALIHNL